MAENQSGFGLGGNLHGFVSSRVQDAWFWTYPYVNNFVKSILPQNAPGACDFLESSYACLQFNPYIDYLSYPLEIISTFSKASNVRIRIINILFLRKVLLHVYYDSTRFCGFLVWKTGTNACMHVGRPPYLI